MNQEAKRRSLSDLESSNTQRQLSVEDPENVEAGEAEIDPAEHAGPLVLDLVQEEEDGVQQVVPARPNV